MENLHIWCLMIELLCESEVVMRIVKKSILNLSEIQCVDDGILIVKNDDIWSTFLEQFNEKSKTVMEYSNATSKDLDKIEEEIAD